MWFSKFLLPGNRILGLYRLKPALYPSCVFHRLFLFSRNIGTAALLPLQSGSHHGVACVRGYWGWTRKRLDFVSSVVTARQQVRSVVNCSKRRGKRKTVKAVARRFHRTGSGKLKYWPAGKVHNMLAKSRSRSRELRKPRYASKTQLKTLNKMISGW